MRALLDAQRGSCRDQRERVGGAFADLEIAGMRREAARGRRQADRDNQIARFEHSVVLRRIARQPMQAPPSAISRLPLRPSISTTASSATSGTQKSDGFVAMQASLQPRIACRRFSPPRASQPEPGWRLLQALAGS